MSVQAQAECSATVIMPTTDLAQKLEDLKAKFEGLGRRQKEHMVQQMAKQGVGQQQQTNSLPAVNQQQEQLHQRPARPMATQVYSFTWRCRLSTFSQLPLPWQHA